MSNKYFNLFLIAIALLCGTPMIPMGICYASPVDMPIPQNIESAIRQAQARYDSGNVSGAAELLTRILERYPDNKEAKALLEKCKETERDDYNNAVSSMSVSSLEAFIKKYPGSSYSDRVHQLIEDLPLWLDASKENTVESYNRYLSNSTQQIYKEEATTAISDLTAEAAYQVAVEKNTIKAYEDFRSSYPGSKRDKDASNKIARLMADKFTSRSTYTDRANALSYAMNEMTRDYVSNKFNAATAKKNSASSSSTSSSSSSVSTTSSNSRMSTNKSTKEDWGIRFGINASVDFGMYSFYGTDEWYDAYPYSLGIAGLIRFGDQRKPLNLITGIRAFMSNENTKYKIWEDYTSYDYTANKSVNQISIPIELNWNFVSSENIGMYLGIGYHYGIQLSQAMKASFGVAWTKGEWNVYYLKYFKGPIYEETRFTPYIGTSYTYYF